MEKELINYARTTNFKVRPDNVLSGGEMITAAAGKYWVYVVVG